jgi:two-component system NtrC family response regulator
MATILIIDDDDNFCGTMESLVQRMGHDFLSARTLSAGMDILSTRDVDILLLDVKLPDGNGLAALPAIRETALTAPEIFIITGIGDPDGAATAIAGGVWDYIVKPTAVNQTRLSLTRALTYREEKKKKQQAVTLNLSGIIGESPPMRQCFDIMARGAASNATVLITGETGTGKELFARTIHANSPRKDQGFVVVDCAALTETLMESTLFGHRKGAFTGAVEKREGLVKLADRGTLFLDEVGEMPLTTQKTFLRVLQEKTFRPVGESHEEKSDFRLIAATNRDLDLMVEEGAFRRDLLYRLRTLHLTIPPLRKRGTDILRLAEFRIDRLCREYGLPPKIFEEGFTDTLTAYPWPGNVRELFNVLETAFVASGNESTLYAMHLPGDLRIRLAKDAIERGRQQAPPESPPEMFTPDTIPEYRAYKQAMERRYLEAVIAASNGDVKIILDRSGMSKSHFYGLLKKYGIEV